MALSTDTLQSLVAHFLGIEPEAISASTPLTGALASSLGRARLDAALRQRLGVKLRACYTARTFGELEATANGHHTHASVPRSIAPSPEVSRAVGLAASVGLDLQSVEELPESADFWTHPFYTEHFTATEIAASLLHLEPRTHFAGIWCAKEALKKGNPELLHVDWLEIEIRLGPDGRPIAYLQKGSEWHQLAASISVTHTGKIAGAIAVFHAS